MRNITKKTEDTNNTINQAFTDINALVAKAKELVYYLFIIAQAEMNAGCSIR